MRGNFCGNYRGNLRKLRRRDSPYIYRGVRAVTARTQ